MGRYRIVDISGGTRITLAVGEIIEPCISTLDIHQRIVQGKVIFQNIDEPGVAVESVPQPEPEKKKQRKANTPRIPKD